MPTPFNLRKRWKSRATNSAPPTTGAQVSSTNSPLPTSHTTPVPSPPTASPAPNAPPTTTENVAFSEALRRHIDKLSPDEKQAFISGNTITPAALVKEARNYDEAHRKTSYSRRCASRVETVLRGVDGFMVPVAIMTGHSPDISSLVVGAVKLVIQLGLKFFTFFSKLTEMMEDLSKHLGYLAMYAENFKHSKDVQEALSAAYEDLLEFCTGAKKVFVDKHGNQSHWVSFRIFLRVTWEPFEEHFGSLNTRFRNNAEIVVRTANGAEHQRQRLKEERDEDKNRRELLLWLSELDFNQDHDVIFKKRHPNTGNWLLDTQEYKDWDNANQSSLLWCYGHRKASNNSHVVTRLI